MDIEKFRTAAVALLGFLASALAAGILPSPYDQWAAIVLAIASVLGVHVSSVGHARAEVRRAGEAQGL